ncbi:DoxX family protein [Myxococcus sp. CA051A]|uniref:DoxX family protein n=1 Tax=unclassified Myxococcus TaxID=2648731 RepID=UPI00157B198E|nr:MULTISPECIES: DoxX family protein [unclassified Myxococcus]NTX39663.1 DoxX family protein [Myxococcus sp. CA033]NTX54727.1 DoxX family protein [Myxococcus sp. CA039A]NTX61440.1 DoxX family protein [Myxococcus sp. CA051A]
MTTAASSTAVSTPSKPWALWLGRAFSALTVAGLGFSAVMKVSQSPDVIKGFEHFGYPASVIVTIGVVELLVALLYAVPQTAVLGAILVTGYLGGATATHVRVADPFIAPIILGVLAWAGLFLRDARLRALLPLRRTP